MKATIYLILLFSAGICKCQTATNKELRKEVASLVGVNEISATKRLLELILLRPEQDPIDTRPLDKSKGPAFLALIARAKVAVNTLLYEGVLDKEEPPEKLEMFALLIARSGQQQLVSRLLQESDNSSIRNKNLRGIQFYIEHPELDFGWLLIEKGVVPPGFSVNFNRARIFVPNNADQKPKGPAHPVTHPSNSPSLLDVKNSNTRPEPPSAPAAIPHESSWQTPALYGAALLAPAALLMWLWRRQSGRRS